MSFSFSPKIVTDGLVLYLDAANTRSYVSGSTVWTDLSRVGNNGLLINGPTFNSLNNGSIVFNGTNQYVDCGVSTISLRYARNIIQTLFFGSSLSTASILNLIKSLTLVHIPLLVVM